MSPVIVVKYCVVTHWRSCVNVSFPIHFFIAKTKISPKLCLTCTARLNPNDEISS